MSTSQVLDQYFKEQLSKSNLPEFKVVLTGAEIKPKVRDQDKTKLGGSPSWIQDAQIPVCKSCKKKLLFVAQIDSLDHYYKNAPGYMFHDCGIIYVFICRDSSCEGSLKPVSILQFY